MMFFTLIMSLSILFLMSFTPLSMLVVLIMQTLLISITLSSFIFTFWYSYMLILIMVSGMLVLFMYMASIASNEKFSWSVTTLLILPFTIFLPMLFQDKMTMYKMNNLEKMMSFQETILEKLFNFKMMMPMLMLVMYLFIMMVNISFLVSNNEGPMRKSN
uniref:NADH dehydrogenase subunit 6 n=1 Tax=Pseudacysta perseae TaxID=1041453 RepID=A0A089QGX7_PSEPZ|nr:NADH dehydrogenase subunit 6 [Pseudacysta perseae]AIR11953.1 NADH dehydrogenase subunit 6 [Pseudacysta perseae]